MGVLFVSDDSTEQEMNPQIGDLSAVIKVLVQSIIVKKELSQKHILLPGPRMFQPSPVATRYESWPKE